MRNIRNNNFRFFVAVLFDMIAWLPRKIDVVLCKDDREFDFVKQSYQLKLVHDRKKYPVS